MKKGIPEVVHLSETDFSESMCGFASTVAYINEPPPPCRIISSLRYGVEELNKLTNQGERRLDPAMKSFLYP